MYLWILFTKPFPAANSSSSTSSSSFSKKDGNTALRRLYLNIFFLDRTEFIHNIVRSKVSKNRRFIRALAKRAAVALLKENIVEKVASGLCKPLTERLEVMGVKCSANIVYAEAAFACIEITFYNVDFYEFFKFNAGVPQAEKISMILDKFSLPAINDFLKKMMVNFLYGKFMVNLPNTLKEKLWNKMSAELEVIPCNEEEQSNFLIQTITQLHADGSKAEEAAQTTPSE